MKPFYIDNLKINLPILQGGMGIGVSLSRLASSIANEGGIGMIAATGLDQLPKYKAQNISETDALRKELRQAKRLSNGVIGVNLLVHSKSFVKQFIAVLEEEADLVVFSGGLPLDALSYIPSDLRKTTQTKFLIKVSSARAARLLFDHWDKKYNWVPDGIVMEGAQAGGVIAFHRLAIDKKESSLEYLIPSCQPILNKYRMKYQKNIAMIAGGGLHSGYDVYQTLNKGADAVLLGSRFVATYECDAPASFKQHFLNSRKGDISIIPGPLGWSTRVIGTKMSYSQTLERDFIPTNFRFGTALTLELDKYNKISVMADVNKLLVPTPPIYADGSTIANPIIESGMDPNRTVADAMISSWYDAPGGMKEEFREFYYGLGVEYAYEEMFFIRGGYFHEHATKGNRKYVTLGLGFNYSVFTLDLSYLVPTAQRNPLEHTLRFTMLFNFLNQAEGQ
jgi:nitronate monooxygenase